MPDRLDLLFESSSRVEQRETHECAAAFGWMRRGSEEAVAEEARHIVDRVSRDWQPSLYWSQAPSGPICRLLQSRACTLLEYCADRLAPAGIDSYTPSHRRISDRC